jgi:CheY-like chemotaxis protein
MSPESFRNKPATPLRVVIAEDDTASRKLPHHFLEQRGYNVCAAADGLRALEILRSEDVPPSPFWTNNRGLPCAISPEQRPNYLNTRWATLFSRLK